jgi:hypothetical protein
MLKKNYNTTLPIEPMIVDGRIYTLFEDTRLDCLKIENWNY